MKNQKSLAGKNSTAIIRSPLYRGGNTSLILQGYDSRGFNSPLDTCEKINNHSEKNRAKVCIAILCKHGALGKLAFGLLVTCLFVNGCVRPALAESVNLSIIERIESGGNPNAVSNKGAIGSFQITPIALRDFNQQTNSQLDTSDLRSAEISAHVAIWLLEVRAPQLLGVRDSVRNRLITFNCGISCVDKRLPLETKNYLKRYKNQGGHL